MSTTIPLKVSSICRYCSGVFGVTFLLGGQGGVDGRGAALAQAIAHRSRRAPLTMLSMSSRSLVVVVQGKMIRLLRGFGGLVS